MDQSGVQWIQHGGLSLFSERDAGQWVQSPSLSVLVERDEALSIQALDDFPASHCLLGHPPPIVRCFRSLE